MPKSKHLPELYESLKRQELYPEATHKIKLQETKTSYLYKDGISVYKVKKPAFTSENIALKQAFYQQEFNLGNQFNSDLYQELISIKKHNGTFNFKGEGEIIDYAIKMKELPQRYFCNNLLEKDKLTPITIGRVARALAEKHLQNAIEEHNSDNGKPDYFYNLCDNKLYQLKRYLNTQIPPPLIDMIRHPLEKLTTKQRKLFSKRISKKRIVDNHGSLYLEHIYVRGQNVYFVSPEENRRKSDSLDAALDVAFITLDLIRSNAEEISEIFIKKYIAGSKDRDLIKILPAYQVYVSLHLGVAACEGKLLEILEEKERLQLGLKYFNLALSFSQKINV